MSSSPSKDGVEKLRVMLADYRHMTKRVGELRKLLLELPKLEEEANATHRKIVEALEGMDVAARGNAGWENRIVCFLNELDTQAQSDPL